MPKQSRTPKRSKLPLNWRSPLRVANFTLLFSIVGILFLVFSKAAVVAGYYGSVEKDQANRINNARSANSKGGLHHIECLNALGELHAKEMADYGRIFHTDDTNRDGTLTQAERDKKLMANRVSYACGTDWTIIGENVGVGYDSAGLFNAFMASAPHKANILDGRVTKVGVGAYYTSDGRLWVTQMFASCSKCGGNWQKNAVTATDPSQPTQPTNLTHYLKNSNSGGSADISPFTYGVSTYRTLYCDWNGDGIDTPAVYDNGTWYIRNSNSAGQPDISFSYGYAAATPACGDWDGNGTDTVGVYDAGNWSLRNSNTAGSPEISFAYGYSAAKPVVGDWNGDGKDTIGVYDAGNWMMRNSNTPGSPEISFAYGYSAALPVVGDWDGNGTDTVGVYDAGNWSLRNSNTAGSPNIAFSYGISGYIPVSGDWNNDRVSSIGVVAK